MGAVPSVPAASTLPGVRPGWSDQVQLLLAVGDNGLVTASTKALHPRPVRLGLATINGIWPWATHWAVQVHAHSERGSQREREDGEHARGTHARAAPDSCVPAL